MKIRIVQNRGKKEIIAFELPKEANCNVIYNTMTIALTMLYAMGKGKRKGQTWIVPKTFMAKLSLVLGWDENEWKNRKILWKLPLKIVEDEK